MINFVIKKDGTKVPFDQEKIKSSIIAAATQAGLSQDDASDMAQKVLDSVSMSFGDLEEAPTSDIKEKVLFELDGMAPEVSASWRKYDESTEK
jgi:transcriptional regulator NrdR family protein